MVRRIAIICACSLVLHAGGAAQELDIVADDAGAGIADGLRAAIGEAEPGATRFSARRQAEDAAERAGAFLNSRGHFSPSVDITIADAEPFTWTLRVDPGPAFALGAVGIAWPEGAPEEAVAAELEAALALARGEAAIPDQIVTQEGALVSQLHGLGYPDARALPRRIVGDREGGTIAVTYRLEPGPRVRLGPVEIVEAGRTDRDYIESLAPFAPGDTYDPAVLSQYSSRLRDTRQYQTTVVRLSESASGPDEPGWETRAVIIELTPRARYTLGLGASFSTANGPGAQARLTRRNVTGRADLLTATATLATQRREIGLNWDLPNARGPGRDLGAFVELGQDETDAFDRDRLTLGATYAIQQTPDLAFAFGAGAEISSETDAFGERTLQVLHVSAAASVDRSDDALDPTAGWRADARIEPATAFGDTSLVFAALSSELRGYRALDSKATYVLAGRARVASVVGGDLESLPVSYRYFAGGGGSARGFAYQSVGPRDANNQPTGGLGLFETSAELRWRRESPLGFVAFVDAVSLEEEATPDISDLRLSAGLGARYRTPAGPLRLDIATPIDREPGDDPVQIYISIGQAF